MRTASMLLIGSVLLAATARAQIASGRSPGPTAGRPAPTSPANGPAAPTSPQGQPSLRLGRPYPAPVPPPAPRAQPTVHVGIVSPQASRFSNRARGGGATMSAPPGGDLR